MIIWHNHLLPLTVSHNHVRTQVEAYITYMDDRGRNACLAAQPRGLIRRWLQPKQERFRGAVQLRISM